MRMLAKVSLSHCNLPNYCYMPSGINLSLLKQIYCLRKCWMSEGLRFNGRRHVCSHCLCVTRSSSIGGVKEPKLSAAVDVGQCCFFLKLFLLPISLDIYKILCYTPVFSVWKIHYCFLHTSCFCSPVIAACFYCDSQQSQDCCWWT